MRTDELLDLMLRPDIARGGDVPVLCADGRMGMLLLLPESGRDDDRCGVQVHGEPEHRRIPAADLFGNEQGALRERGAPLLPVNPARIGDSTAAMVQVMLAADWAQRGGPFISTGRPRSSIGPPKPCAFRSSACAKNSRTRRATRRRPRVRPTTRAGDAHFNQ